MTVQTSTSVANFSGNGVATVFPFSFKFNDDSDLTVLLTDATERSVRQLTLNSDYTAQGAKSESGGSVTLVIAPPVGKTLRVLRMLDILQITSLRNQGKFLAETHEDVFDTLTMIAQQQQEQISRSLTVPPYSDETSDDLIGSIFDARDSAAESAVEAGEIADKFGDVDYAVDASQSAAVQSEAARALAFTSSLVAQSASAVAQTAADSAHTSAKIYANTAAGLVATPSGQYFSVVSPDSVEYLILYVNAGGTAVEQKRYPSAQIDRITINKGKGFPNRQTIRAGVFSAPNSFLNNTILNVQVVNARAGEYYHIAYQQNETNYNGSNLFNWIIKKFDSATYATTGAGGVVLVALSDTQPQFTRTGGVQTVSVVPRLRPEMQFVITVDPTGLPAAGTAINANSDSGLPAWSWIIDPSCYSFASEYKSPEVDIMSINATKVFPLNLSLARGGVANADYPEFRNLFLDIEIMGAEEGKLYRVAYVAATAAGAGRASLGFILEEFDKATYESTGTAVRLQNFATQVGVINRAGGVQTLAFATTVKPSLRFKITMDGAKIPADGAVFASVNPGFPARNWFIDESRYKQVATTSGPVTTVRAGTYFEFDAVTRRLAYAYASGAWAYKVTVGPNGYNELPNLISIHRAPLVEDLSTAAWVLLSTADTDYLPPMVFRAVNNGDGGTTIYTGGAHGADGGGAGGQTARNILWAVYADGKLVDTTSSGYANSVTGQIVNELFAYNTITLNRYALRQTFGLDMSGSGMEVHADITALEDIQVNTDNGPQAYFGGFNDTQLLSDSIVTARVALDPAATSGPRSAYPNAWLLLMKHANGTMACWVDRSYEAGDGRYVHPDSPFIRGGGVGRAKFYNAIVAAQSASIAAGASYKWRGGYHFFADTAESGFDTKAALTIGRTTKLVAVYPTGKSLVI